MKIKILFIIHNAFGVGGVQKVLSTKANGLVDRGYEVLVYSANTRGDLYFDYSDKVLLIDGTISGNGLSYFFNFKKNIQKLLKIHHPTHIFVLDNGLKGLLIPFFTHNNTKVFYERHGEILVEEKHKQPTFFQSCRNVFLKIAYRFLSKKFHAIIVLTDEMALEWQHPHILVLANPVKVSVSKKPDMNLKNCVFCGRFSPEKGFNHLFTIWQKALIKNPDWNLLIFTNDVVAVENLVKSVFGETEKTIQVSTFKKNLNEVYAKGSVLLSTSISEGFPVTISEALVFGLPVIAFDCDFGPRKLIDDSQNGFLIPLGNEVIFTEKLNELQSDVLLRNKMGLASFVKSQNYTASNYFDKLENLLLSHK